MDGKVFWQSACKLSFEDAAAHSQPRGYKPSHSSGEEFLNRQALSSSFYFYYLVNELEPFQMSTNRILMFALVQVFKECWTRGFGRGQEPKQSRQLHQRKHRWYTVSLPPTTQVEPSLKQKLALTSSLYLDKQINEMGVIRDS